MYDSCQLWSRVILKCDQHRSNIGDDEMHKYRCGLTFQTSKSTDLQTHRADGSYDSESIRAIYHLLCPSMNPEPPLQIVNEEWN